jgi:hypothetical protein
MPADTSPVTLATASAGIAPARVTLRRLHAECASVDRSLAAIEGLGFAALAGDEKVLRLLHDLKTSRLPALVAAVEQFSADAATLSPLIDDVLGDWEPPKPATP